MRMLYVDNYRGFTSTWIPVADVNFLVGENSTGKTSILSLINVLGSFEFWWQGQFNNDEVELGAFRDIVSASRPDATSFSIGVIECVDGEDFPSSSQCAFLMRFTQHRGMPRLKEWSFVSGDHQIRASFGPKRARYTTQEITPNKDLPSTLQQVFHEWLNEPITATGYKQLSREQLGPYRLLHIYVMLRSLAAGKPLEDMEQDGILRPPIPSFAQVITWLAPVRSKPARIYSGLRRSYSPEGDHMPGQVRQILGGEKASERFHQFTQSFGKDSHLFDEIYVRNFGRGLTSAFELGITLGGASYVISDVGYGVSQALPILVELYSSAGRRNNWYAMQQPEVHLHPKAQAAIGDLVFETSSNDEQRFLIETHSDYLIDRFRIRVRESDPRPSLSCQVLFFERDEDGNSVVPVEIHDDGSYSDGQPEGFRSFFIHEKLRLLGL